MLRTYSSMKLNEKYWGPAGMGETTTLNIQQINFLGSGEGEEGQQGKRNI